MGRGLNVDPAWISHSPFGDLFATMRSSQGRVADRYYRPGAGLRQRTETALPFAGESQGEPMQVGDRLNQRQPKTGPP